MNGFYIKVFRGIYSGFMGTEDYPGSFDDWFWKFYQDYHRRYDDWLGQFGELVSLYKSDHNRLYPGSVTFVDPKDEWIANIDVSGTMLKISWGMQRVSLEK